MAFEKSILEILNKKHIKCTDKKYQDESGQYQCDVLFVLGTDLFICECKAWSEDKNIKGFYNQQLKREDAKQQLDRITKKYIEILDQINKEFEMTRPFRSITNVVFLTNAVGENNKISDTYFIDYSCFSKFIERDEPSMVLRSKDRMLKFILPGFPEYKGAITFHRFMTFLNRPSPVILTAKNSKIVIRKMPIESLEINYELLEKKVDLFNISIEEKKTQEIIKEIYNIK